MAQHNMRDNDRNRPAQGSCASTSTVDAAAQTPEAQTARALEDIAQQATELPGHVRELMMDAARLLNGSRQAPGDRTNASRYRKLRGWMSSNVQEGWQQVEQLAAIACYVDWDTFDLALDDLPECNVGLMQRSANAGPASKH